ncbi:APC family permease [Saccharopolyspora spinosa]|uniref:Amino acid transporter n=1 Tax=Saccharopolyspora spinosa TaxID=60894 RepID=A0A2N3Y0C5_SACSN|nr:APC family permease [Saccharopolyspora spinosa]PKW16360.1 amino acid transporter [Saccharopolyspora spinosa]
MTQRGNNDGSSSGAQLKANSVGIFGMVFMVMAVTAPLTAMASNISLSLAFGVGAGTVGVIVLVTLILLVFSAGYVALSRHVVDAGAYFAYISRGLGPAAGTASAIIATIAYNAAAAAMATAVGYFGNVALSTYLGVDLPWYALTALVLAVTWLIGFLGVSAATGVNAWVSVSEFLLLLVLVVAVLVRRPAGFSLDVFAPHSVSGGNIGLAMVFVLLCFGGYEAAAIYGEEARAARKNVARATYTALVLLAFVFLAATWAVVAAVDDVVGAARKDPGVLVIDIANTYLGNWVGPVLTLMITFSFFAAAISFHNMAARYMFSLGRVGLLPGALSRVHSRRGTPVVAGTTQMLISVAVVAPFAIIGADPLVNLFPAVSGITSLAMIYLLSACCASVVRAAKLGRITGSAWSVLVAPVVSGLALVGCGVLILWNYGEVTGSDSVVINLLPSVLVVGAVYGVLAHRRRRSALSELTVVAGDG